jgi:hypothetical protein
MPVEWNTKRRWFERNGKPIPQQRVRQWVLATVERAKERLKGIGDSYLDHRNTSQWIIDSRSELTKMHTALAMIAQGGREQMDVKSWGRVGQMIRGEAEYLRQFEISLAKGEVSDLQMLSRIVQYGEAGWVTYQNMVAHRERTAGVQYAKWEVDESAENCDGCVGAVGVHKLEDLPEVGSHECRSNCRCTITFLESEDVAA